MRRRALNGGAPHERQQGRLVCEPAHDGVPVGVGENRGRGQLGEKFPHNGFHGRSKDEPDALFKGGCDGPYPLCHIAQKFPVIEETTQKGT